MTKGWKGEKHRHSIAKKGIRTKINNSLIIKETDTPEYIWILQQYSGAIDGIGDLLEEEFYLYKHDAELQKDLLIHQHFIPEHIKSRLTDDLIQITKRKSEKLQPDEKIIIKKQIKEYEMEGIEKDDEPDDYYGYCASQHLDISQRNRG